MKIKANVGTLNDAFGIVSHAVSQRTTLPITRGILMSVKDNQITLTATDMELRMTTNCEAEEAEEGMVVIPAKLFGDIIKSFSKESSVTIETKGDKVSIDCNTSHFDISAEDADEFPQGEKEDGKEITLIGTDLKEMIDRSIFATSDDEARGVITGELLEFNKNGVNIVAIDGFRMAIRKSDTECKEEVSTIIPAKALIEISRLLTDDFVNLYIGKKFVTVKFADTVVEVKVLAGNFVDYKGIIPQNNPNIIRVKVEDFLGALERTLLVTSDVKDRLVILDIGETLELSSKSEAGSAHEEVTVDHKGDDLHIGFNGRYLLDALKSIEDEEVDVTFNGPLKPALFKPVDSDKFLYLTLPVRIG